MQLGDSTSKRIRKLTCSRVLHTLLPSPPSLSNLLKIIKGVSVPLPSLDFEDAMLNMLAWRAKPPRMTNNTTSSKECKEDLL